MFSFFYWCLCSSSERRFSSTILTDMNRNSVWYFANVIFHSVFVFRIFLFTEWEQSFPSLIIHFFVFSELTLVNNSVLHEDIHPQICSVLFVGFILISCILHCSSSFLSFSPFSFFAFVIMFSSHLIFPNPLSTMSDDGSMNWEILMIHWILF